jgi:4-(2-carboxyphenyl)-2-oxobut-3-enoate aldolase
MSTKPKVSGRDMRGVMAYPPTPALPGAERVDATDTVDLTETERMIRTLITDGVDAIALNGTLGECATLTLEEWKAFAACAQETAEATKPGFSLFIGSTTLNTRDTVARMRYLADLGVTGTLLGRPMWGNMVGPVMEHFYRDVAEAVPELAIVVYDNTAAFGGVVPRPVGRIPLPQRHGPHRNGVPAHAHRDRLVRGVEHVRGGASGHVVVIDHRLRSRPGARVA